MESYLDEWDMREKCTGVRSKCCGVEAFRGGISGVLYCAKCGLRVEEPAS